MQKQLAAGKLGGCSYCFITVDTGGITIDLYYTPLDCVLFSCVFGANVCLNVRFIVSVERLWFRGREDEMV